MEPEQKNADQPINAQPNQQLPQDVGVVPPTLTLEVNSSTLTKMTNPNKPRKLKSSIFLIIIIVIAIVAAFVFIFLIRNKPKNISSGNGAVASSQSQSLDTSNWRTAISRQYKLKYKYPQDTNKHHWFAKEGTAVSVEVGSGLSYVEFTEDPILISIAKLGSQYDDGTTYQTYIEKNNIKETDVLSLISTDKVTKSGITGTCWAWKAKQKYSYVGSKEIHCHFVNGQLSYLVEIHDNRLKGDNKEKRAAGDLDLVAYGESIFSTLEFIK
ncbi:MAG: hypothetical protein ACXWLH_02785 [Candidatus Saccharimonadales bacterium]